MGAAPVSKLPLKPEALSKIQEPGYEPSKLIDTVNVSLSTGNQRYQKVDTAGSPRASKDLASCETTKSGTGINYNVFTCTTARQFGFDQRKKSGAMRPRTAVSTKQKLGQYGSLRTTTATQKWLRNNRRNLKQTEVTIDSQDGAKRLLNLNF